MKTEAEKRWAEKNGGRPQSDRIFFHLVENPERDTPFAFMATYSVRTAAGEIKQKPLKYALTEYQEDRQRLQELAGILAEAAEASTLIAGFVKSAELLYPLRLTSAEAWQFLKEIPAYEAAGILCRVPDWWSKNTNKLQVQLTIGEEGDSYAGLQTLLTMRPAVMADGEELSLGEIERLTELAEGLIFLKGRWIEVNHERLQQILAVYEKLITADKRLSLAQAMRMELDTDRVLPDRYPADLVQISNGQWLNNLKEELRSAERTGDAAVPVGVSKKLRPYQKRGAAWLTYMQSVGFGACLADDMGLGKSVQVLAMLESIRKQGHHVLLIVPATLPGSWEREIKKFVPGLPYQMLHGKTAKNLEQIYDPECFLTITSYGMAGRLPFLQQQVWDLIVLDEAQAIKNPAAKVTQNIKQLQAQARIILTGTPIENSLMDLWSLFDFLNRGLLGTEHEFRQFQKKAAKEGHDKLRNMIAPFILRRMKTDKAIISDLPPKIEIKEYVRMTKTQAVLYRDLIRKLQEQLEGAGRFKRRGLILASLMRCKQICNHPDQYTGLAEYKAEASGKFIRLGEICKIIAAKRERVLIFTQFRELTEPLSEYLEQIFHRKGLVLHGGTAAGKRMKLVEQFNGQDYVPYMVLSLKAGGVGLNLTAANHVIHFDRWWNPAVENQATDRVFRIGQEKTVIVYKLIAEKTIEEKTDQLLAEKEELSKELIAEGNETWITEYSDQELINLFRLDY